MLHEGRGEEGPWVVKEAGWDEGQVRDRRGFMMCCLHRRRHGIDCPPSCEVVEKGEGDEDDEEDSSDRGDIDSWGHLGEGRWALWMAQDMAAAGRERDDRAVNLQSERRDSFLLFW